MKPAWAKIGVGILATIGALYAGLALVTPLLVARKCTVYPVTTVASPAGKWQAEQVQWSAFRAVSSQPTGPSGVYEPVRLQLVWLNESELQISYPLGTALQHGERTEDGFRVRYQELASGSR